MSHGRKINKKSNKLYDRALRITHKDYTYSIVILLGKDRSVTMHQKSVQLLMTDIFLASNHLNPSFMQEIFLQRGVTYDLRNADTFLLPLVQTVNHGTEAIRYREQRIWQSLPQEVKNSTSVHQLKKRIRPWNSNCDCRLCKQFIYRIGFL